LPGILGNRRPAAIVSSVQCESSGYESIVRDSECSSFGSSQDSDPGEPHDPGGSKKGADCNLVLEEISNFKYFMSMILRIVMTYLYFIICVRETSKYYFKTGILLLYCQIFIGDPV
jgi:hypothetical protein